MSFFSNLFKKNKNVDEYVCIDVDEDIFEDEDEITAVISAVVASMNEEEEIVAAITVAIACILGTSTNDFIVKNIKRTPQMDSVWSHVGRMNLMR